MLIVPSEERAQELEARLKRAIDCLREWRDRHGGKEHYKIVHYGSVTGGSPTDLLRDTQRLIEGK